MFLSNRHFISYNLKYIHKSQVILRKLCQIFLNKYQENFVTFKIYVHM